MDETRIQEFWNEHPCGDFQVGGLQNYRSDYESFFNDYDKFRYCKEGHILKCLDEIDFKDKQVLEIGLGQGADSEQIIRRGAHWSGIDLTPESVERVRVRMELRNLPYGELRQASALALPIDDNRFDIVFSHGVLHHIPDVRTAQKEIHRVLRPGGMLVAMLYARWSLNYLIAIGVVRRLGLGLMYAAGRRPPGIYGQHLDNARAMGLMRYLRMENFVHRNTDGPLNPYSKVYDVAEVRRSFPDFEIVRAHKEFMHAPPLKVGFLRMEHLLGWHLWVHMKPRKT